MGTLNGDQEHPDCGVTAPEHQSCCEYMKEQSLTESAVWSRLLSNFFDGSGHQSPRPQRKGRRDRRLESGHRFPQAALDGFGAGRGIGEQRPKPALKRPRYKDHK